MITNYGFQDGSGDWYVTIDTDKCNGCSKCIDACPAHALEVTDNEYDPFGEEQVARVVVDERKKIKYTCAPCKPGYGPTSTPCVAACEPGAVSCSNGWQLSYGIFFA
jgi:ferredoxin